MCASSSSFRMLSLKERAHQIRAGVVFAHKFARRAKWDVPSRFIIRDFLLMALEARFPGNLH